MSALVEERVEDSGTRRMERAMKALEVSGRRLFERSDGWVVALDRRRRPVVRLSDGEARDLIASGAVTAAVGGGYARACAAAEAVITPAYVAAGLARSRSRGAGFIGLVRAAEHGEGPLSLRAALAGMRLVRDAETAERRSALTMDWNAAPSDARRRGPGEGGLSRTASAAAARLARLKRAGGDAFALAWAGCVEGLPLAALETRFGLERRRGSEALGVALEIIADGYDGR